MKNIKIYGANLFLAFVASLPLLGVGAGAQTVGEIQEGKPWQLLYEHNGVLPSSIYVNGLKLTNFTIAQINVSTNFVPAGGTNAPFTLTVNMPALDRGQYRITATVIDPVAGESDPSLPLNLKAKPKAPWWLRLF